MDSSVSAGYGRSMGRELRTQIDVAAPPSLGWQVLTDFAHYPDWNPFIIEASGSAVEKETIAYRFEFPRGIRVRTKARILRAEPDAELRWEAHFISAALFNGEHYFVIRPSSESSFVFHHGEVFTGALLPLALPVLQRSGPPIYRQLTVKFKERVEQML